MLTRLSLSGYSPIFLSIILAYSAFFEIRLINSLVNKLFDPLRKNIMWAVNIDHTGFITKRGAEKFRPMHNLRPFSIIAWIALPAVMFGGYSLLGILISYGLS